MMWLYVLVVIWGIGIVVKWVDCLLIWVECWVCIKVVMIFLLLDGFVVYYIIGVIYFVVGWLLFSWLCL